MREKGKGALGRPIAPAAQPRHGAAPAPAFHKRRPQPGQKLKSSPSGLPQLGQLGGRPPARPWLPAGAPGPQGRPQREHSQNSWPRFTGNRGRKKRLR